MPLFSEHISNMYYSGSPSYTSPSYGYKSSFSPIGTSYSASYLSPGGSYSKHSSLSSYSRPPLSSRWIPGISRSYSPLLTPISERGTASPIRINSPRRIPISKRCYGAPSYIQRPININTESIDVSRDRYRSKPAEPSASAPFTPQQRDESVKDNKNSPFMPRVDGKPETGIDSSPGMQRSTIKRGRTVVRLHTIKRKEKDSPRKPAYSSQLQDSEVNRQDAPDTLVDVIADDPRESLSWREKLSEDLVYVDKKEKKSLGTKLVEKFLVRDLTEKESQIDKRGMRSNEGSFQTIPETLLPSCEAPSTSKSPDRRCSMELLAEQASLLDSLIRGENLSTATLDLSKVGITDETNNKFVSSVSIKRRKTDDKGNPLKTTKSDNSLHDNLNKNLNGNKDFKILSKKQSLKKSHSGGSICRLDSITEFTKEPDLPAIQENSISLKEQKAEQKPKLKTKITASVEITPPISPLKFRIDNVVVEEKHHLPKKEISFSYNMDELQIQDVTLQDPKTTLRRTKERNSIKKKSQKAIGSAPISPEPEDGNFWAKIGKRETVNLMKRKQIIEATKEENKKSFLWFPENEETNDISNDAVPNVDIEKTGDSIKQEASSDLLLEPEANILPKVTEGNVDETEDGQLKIISCKFEKSNTSDNMPKKYSDTNNLSLKEKAPKPIVEPKNDIPAVSNKTSLGKLFRQDAEIKDDVPFYKENDDIKNKNNSIIPLNGIKTKINEISTNIETSNIVILEISQPMPSSPVKDTAGCDKTPFSTTYLDTDVKSKSKENNVINGSNSTVELNVTEAETKITINKRAKCEGNNHDKDTKPISEKNESMKSIPALRTRAKSEGKSLEKTSKSISNETEIIKVDSSVNLCPEAQSKLGKAPEIKASVLKTRAKSEGKSLKKDSKPISKITKIQTASVEGNLFLKTPPVEAAPGSKVPALKTPAKSPEKDSKIINDIAEKMESENSNIGVNLNAKTSNEKKINTVVVESVYIQAENEDKNVEMAKKTGSIESESNVNINTNDTTKTETKSVNTTSPLEIQTENKVQSLDKYFNHTDEIESDKANVDALSVESKTNVTLHTQAKSKPEPLVNHNQRDTVISNISKQIMPESTKNNMPTEKIETNSKKKTNKAEDKAPEKNTETKTDNISSTSTDTVCKTCKKTLKPNSSKNTKLNVTSINDPSTSTPSQGNENIVQINARADNNAPNNMQEEQSVLDISLVNPSNSNLNTSLPSTSSSHLPVIEIKDIPREKVVSYTEQVPTSVPSQEATGEENKADTSKDEDLNKLKRPSIKEAHISPAKPIKEEKATKPLIATPRPLKKRAPQVIHSDSSGSSSEDDSSEEDSDTSEECGEFYECENNPDGRTSTGSNDSGFDSSAPTSPASFLQIKKDCDVNCHRKCEKLTANLCGVNQRLLVEALATRTASKKGGESPGPSSSNASSQLPATDVVDSELELEQSTAYGIFRKTGRFTPPARSIPRFRKYNIEDFQFIKVLGKGSFGKVLLAELRDTEYYYAVKCLKKDVVLEDDDVECTLIERKVLALGTNHPYLCHLFATFQTDSHLFFVMEYLNGGDLMFHIQQSGRFPEARARFYAAEIVSGLKFLHKRGIVYRDLKLDNILLDFDGHVRIADFGMCKLQIYLDKTADTFCGTPDYMAPEIIKGLKYNQTVDWWSFGVLLYEMLIGQSPFSGCDEDELFWSICNEMPSYPRFLSRESLTILTRLLDKDARTRLGGTECMHGDVREQEFFHPVHWDKLERRELETPFKPRVRHPLDTQYFDRAFTGERPRLTAVEPQVLRSMDQEPFRGFSYTNPNATDR